MSPREDYIEPVGAVNSDKALSMVPQAGSVAGGGLPGQERRSSTEALPSAGTAGRTEAPDKNETNGALPQAAGAQLTFERDDKSGRMVAMLKDPKTGEVIRQLPPEEMLKIAESIDKYLGLLVDKHS